MIEVEVAANRCSSVVFTCWVSRRHGLVPAVGWVGGVVDASGVVELGAAAEIVGIVKQQQ